MAIGSALKKLMAIHEITQKDLAEKIGITRQAVSRWCKDQSDPTTEKLAELAKFFNIPINDFFDGSRIDTCVPDEENPPENTVAIPEFEFKVAAGDDYINDWEQIHNSTKRWYSIDFFRDRHLDPRNCIRCTAHGESMFPTICDGDKILFALDNELTVQRIHDGAIYVLSVDGALRVKRLSFQNGCLVITSDNPEYPKEIHKKEALNNIRIYGRVIEVTRSL